MNPGIRLICVLLALTAAAALAACDPGDVNSCDLEHACVAGFACNPQGVCIPAEALRVVTAELPAAAAGVDYQLSLVASGGIPPYRWALTTEAAWLLLEPEAGVLYGRPLEASADIPVEVRVSDSSFGPGQTASGWLLLAVRECPEGTHRSCYQPEGARCREGVQTCAQGDWGECDSTSYSAVLTHCGADCTSCDLLRADRCLLGECACGSGPLCPVDEVCCGGVCVDVQSDIAHCGRCGRDCRDEVTGADGIACRGGACGFSDCLPTFLDCNGGSGDGCEVSMGPANCGGCGWVCEQMMEHVSGAACETGADGVPGCTYQACEPLWLDCDGDPAFGCETPLGDDFCGACDNSCPDGVTDHACVEGLEGWRCGCELDADCAAGMMCCPGADGAGGCVRADDPAHCGACDLSCLESPAGPVCLDPVLHQCGCRLDSDCGQGRLCCDGACHDNSESDCGECGHNCAAYPTDHACVFDTDLDAFRCGCSTEGDCAADELCCGGRCTPIDDDHCGQCGRACSPAEGGPHCDLATRDCYCGSDGECNTFSGSAQTCEGVGVHARCACGDSGPCAGGPASQCCQTAPAVFACLDLRDDPQNCGRCGLACVQQPLACSDGRCSCAFGLGGDPDTCPLDDGTGYNCRLVATQQLCACPTAPIPSDVCPEGRYCCDGTAGGHGGGGGADDFGCCLLPCGDNAEGECAF